MTARFKQSGTEVIRSSCASVVSIRNASGNSKSAALNSLAGITSRFSTVAGVSGVSSSSGLLGVASAWGESSSSVASEDACEAPAPSPGLEAGVRLLEGTVYVASARPLDTGC